MHYARSLSVRKDMFGEGVRPELGRFETWICLRCGFTELYAQKLPHDIEAIAKQAPRSVAHRRCRAGRAGALPLKAERLPEAAPPPGLAVDARWPCR